MFSLLVTYSFVFLVLFQKNELSDEVIIEQKWHKLIIGANGENMKEIHDRYSGVHVAFPEPGRRSNTVTLRGPSEEVKQCKQYMEKHARDIVRYINDMINFNAILELHLC